MFSHCPSKLAFLFLAVVVPTGLGATIYVDGTNGNDAWSGLCDSWQGGSCGPKRTIQAGINVAVLGDTVIVGRMSPVDRRLILVRETFVLGEDEYTKTDSSQRDIQMSRPVYEALKRQSAATSKVSEYVFCNREGHPLDNKNFSDRVWYPLLRHLGYRADVIKGLRLESDRFGIEP